MSKYAIGGNLLKDIKIPKLDKFAIKLKNRGEVLASSMKQGALMIRDIFKSSERDRNFRLFCPDEIESNLLHGIFEATKRAYVWPLPENAEDISPDGRAMEVLSEHNLQGWMQGYILTGRHGIFCSYEAFTMIIASMVDQYAKFLKQSMRVKWRKPLSSPIYIQSSVGWRQEHNGYSHQNPGFVSNVLEKHGEFSQIFYPADANSFIVALEESFKRKNGINVIVADKRNLPQWLSLDEARKQAKTGIGVWDWATSVSSAKNPDVVLASCGDYMTVEAMMAIKICKEMVPEMKIRYVNVSEISGVCVGDFCNMYSPKQLSIEEFNKYFTKDKPVVFNYHGYINDVEQIFWRFTDHTRFSIHGYSEEGSTTTPFDMAIRNKVSRYHLVIDMIEQASKKNKKVAQKKKLLLASINKIISDHHKYICEFGDDPKEIKDQKWA
jgi:xylulose-5-phosphate/fructose-6-phosphate phosphoketolase